MDKVLEYIQLALNWVNDPTHKTLLFMAGGWVLNRWPAFVNKAIPGVTTVASILLGVSQLLVAAVTAAHGGVQGASFVHAVAAEAGQASLGGAIVAAVIGTILPVWVSTGHYSWLKNVAQWIVAGMELTRKKEVVPTKSS